MSIDDLIPGRPLPDELPENLLAGKILDDPADTEELVRVRLTIDRDQYVGPCRWTPRNGRLPAVGDECLVAFGDQGAPAIVWWGPADAPAEYAVTLLDVDQKITEHAETVAEDGPAKVRKTADETVNNSAVLQNDDHLALPVSAGELWAVDLRLLYSIASASSLAIKCGFTVPAGATFYWDTAGNDGRAAATTGTLNLAATAGATGIGRLFGTYVGGANAGTLQLQWAQLAAHASDSKVLANSVLVATKLN